MIPSLLDKGAYLFSFLRATVTEKTTVGVPASNLAGVLVELKEKVNM
jgi:hypothetical protein